MIHNANTYIHADTLIHMPILIYMIPTITIYTVPKKKRYSRGYVQIMGM